MTVTVMVRTTILVLLLSCLTSHRSRTAFACSCIPDSFEGSFDLAQSIDVMYNFGQVKVNDKFEFIGLMDDDNGNDDDNNDLNPSTEYDRDLYFLVWTWFSYKGCAPQRQYEILISAERASLCGIHPSRGWFIMETYPDTYANTGLRRIGLCRVVVPWDKFNYTMFLHAEENKEDCS